MAKVFTQAFVVVGALIEKDGKFLLAQEAGRKLADAGKWNQPAGWMDVGENPFDAVRREVLEETGMRFTPTHLLGVYSLVRNDITSERGTPHAVKLIFLGTFEEGSVDELHDDISKTQWFTVEEIEAMDTSVLRDRDIKQEIKDYLAGKRFPLSSITHTEGKTA